MTWQEVIDLLQEEEKKAIERLIVQHPESDVFVYRRLIERIKSKLRKEAEHGMAKR